MVCANSAVALALLPTSAAACTVCMGESNSQVAGAMNAAIFMMLGLTGSMLAGLGGFAFYLRKRANAPLPPHLEFVTKDDSEET